MEYPKVMLPRVAKNAVTGQ